MSDEQILALAERYSRAFRSPTSDYTAEDVFILMPEELLQFAHDLRERSMREVE